MDLNKNSRRGATICRTASVLALAGLALGLGGCETDSFLLDPSVIGRWEHTPTRVPVLNRLASIEGPGDDFVEYSDVKPEDLLPEVTEYRIGPGDRLTVLTYDIPEEGRVGQYEPTVDARGFINIPQLGELDLNGLTAKEAEQVVMGAMKALVTNPLSSIKVDSQRQLRFSIFGGVQTPGQYQVPVANYKLLEGLSAAGSFSETPEYIYVIRQVALTKRAAAGGLPSPARPPEGARPAPRPGENITDIIDQLSKPQQQPPKPPPGSPSRLRSAQPEGTKPPIDLIDPKAAPAPAVQPPAPAKPATPAPAPAAAPSARAETKPAAQPAAPIPLPQQPAQQPTQVALPPSTPDSSDGAWVFVNGQWVKVAQPSQQQPLMPNGDTTNAAGQQLRAESLVSQRIIRVPVQRLVNGDARYNIILRPGDIVRVPPQPAGTIFIGGTINRVGSYSLQERLTLTAAIMAAGGLSSIAVPERVDLKRMVGNDQQAIIRLNLRAIAEGTHPNIYLKANDEINIGTNFWATPLAIIRNGFRATYGFGFLVDRNFGNDIFGAPPENRVF